MTTSSNSIPTNSNSTVKRKRGIVVGVAPGVGAATVAASAFQSGSAVAHDADPAAVYAELVHVTEWATAQGLSGLSPASLRSSTD